MLDAKMAELAKEVEGWDVEVGYNTFVRTSWSIITTFFSPDTGILISCRGGKITEFSKMKL